MSVLTNTKEFIKDIRMEFTKVSWPTRHEVRSSTKVVIVAVMIMSVFIGVVDRIITFGMGFLFR
jgi:preprotein translocase subunit SecE